METVNLFGETVTIPEDKKGRSPYIDFKRGIRFRVGTPERCCKRCKYLRVIRYHSRSYRKCHWIGDSRSTATDITLKNVCNLFEERTEPK